MGGQRDYLSSGGFTQYLYYQDGDVISANGKQGKIVTKIDTTSNHSGLPQYSNTSNIYFKKSDTTKQIEQMRYYVDRRAAIDFDWDHEHRGIKKGIVHVHIWGYNRNGEWVRCYYRQMNNSEMKEFGPIIKKANPNAKFR